MNEVQQKAIEHIKQLQAKEKPRSAQWMVGEQLKDICRSEPRSAELLWEDLQQPGMGLKEAEKKIKAHADAHKTGNFACVTPAEADKILRAFYGLPEARPTEAQPRQHGRLRLEDLR